MANKKFRIWIIVISIPIFLIIAAAVALKIYFTNERLKSLIIPKIEETTNRKVEIGDISLSIFPTFGVKIEEFRISSPRSELFEKSDFIYLKNLLLDVKIFPLLKNRVEINEIILKQPDIYLEVNNQGINNYSIPEEKEEVKSDQDLKVEKRKTWSGSFLLSNFQIIEGKIEYVNKKEDNRILINNIYQKTRARTLPNSNNFELESEVDIRGINYGSIKNYLIKDLPLKAKQKITYLTEEDKLIIDNANISINEILMEMKGSISRTQEIPFVEIETTSSNTELSHLLSIIPQDFLKSAQGLSAEGKFNLALFIKGEVYDTVQPAINGKFNLINGKIKYANLPRSITNINIDGGFERTQKLGKFGIEKLNLNVGDNLITGKLNVVDFDNPSLTANFNGKVNLGEIMDIYPLERETKLSGIINANIMLDGKVKVPTSVKANGKIEINNVMISLKDSPNPVKNLNGVITFNNQIIESRNFGMDIGESDLQLKFTLKNYLSLLFEKISEVGKPSAYLTLTSNNLRTVDLISEKPKDEKKIEKEESILLPIPNVDIEANVSIEKFSTEKFDFTNARGSMNISAGIISLRNFSFNAFQGNIITKGKLDLRKPDNRPFDLDLEIVGVEANSFLSKFTSFGKNLFGKFTMNSTMKGSLDDTLGILTQTLAGEGRVQIFDGKFIGYPVMASIADFTGIDELRGIDFKNWSNTFTISNGRINIKDLNIAAGNTDFSVYGSQGFDGTLDYSTIIKLPQFLSDKLKIGGTMGQALNLLKDKDGRLNLNLFVGGNILKPIVGLDTKAQQRQIEELARQEIDKKKSEIEGIIREEVKQIEDSLKQKSIEELKKKGEDALKKLFKRP